MLSRITCKMPSSAMEPTIKKGDWVASDTKYYFSNKPERFEVAVFWAPDVEREILDIARAKVGDEASIDEILSCASEIMRSRNQTIRPHLLYIKRIVGLPGEEIRFTETDIEINGEKAKIPRDLRKAYSKFPKPKGYRFGGENTRITEDAVFVVSDNLGKGVDSRHVGPVPVGNLFARVGI
ncbi:signal peptidase I [Mesorhizobium sp. M1380]|uniref:signal peptidase I n=1 Tax=Mesorhizobium sp. M1380 TaxID=2957093 RepID=UPI00333648C8